MKIKPKRQQTTFVCRIPLAILMFALNLYLCEAKLFSLHFFQLHLLPASPTTSHGSLSPASYHNNSPSILSAFSFTHSSEREHKNGKRFWNIKCIVELSGYFGTAINAAALSRSFLSKHFCFFFVYDYVCVCVCVSIP